MSDLYHHHDIANSLLYTKSVELNCMLENIENSMYTNDNNEMSKSFVNESSTMMRGFIDPYKEQTLRTEQYDIKNKCYANSSYDNTVYPNSIGYECNTNMMYALDNFNTYHNYPVCKIRDNNKVACCPENIQIFDNITRRNVEIPSDRPAHDLIVEAPIIPQLQYNKCFYK